MMLKSSSATSTLVLALLASPASASSYAYDPLPVVSLNPKRATAGEYRLEQAHSSVTMKLSHMGLSFYTLRFNSVKGHYGYDPVHPTASRIEVSIDPASIDTGNPTFNGVIAKSYFEAERYPEIKFTSVAIRGTPQHGSIAGVLEMHGVRKPITLRVSYHGFTGAEKPERMGFSATARLKRSEFGVDPYVPAEGDEVTVLIEAEFLRKTEG